ncbi:MAG: M23 family metallopeptidase [Succinivibrionaceae bacterium]
MLKFHLLITIFVFTFSVIPISQAKILRYVDESGVVTYTDDEEDAKSSGYEYDEYDDFGSPDPNNVQFRFDSYTNRLYVINKFASEITVRVRISDPSAVESDVLFNHPIEIAGNTEYLLGFIKQIDGKEATITNEFDIGRIYTGNENFYYSMNPNDLIVPFVGQYKVTQGWEGGFTHRGPKNRYAIDVSMPIGTKILAVKSGKIIDMRMSSNKGGNNPQFRAFANFIKIQHDDGTMSVYVHLKCDSQTVNIGQYVQQGQVIALSGNTGYTTGPHLHFALQTNTNNGVKSIKFKLHNKEPLTGTLLKN